MPLSYEWMYMYYKSVTYNNQYIKYIMEQQINDDWFKKEKNMKNSHRIGSWDSQATEVNLYKEMSPSLADAFARFCLSEWCRTKVCYILHRPEIKQCI